MKVNVVGLVQHLSNREHLCEIAKTLDVRLLKTAFKPVQVPVSKDCGPLRSDEITVLVDRYKQGESVRQLATAFDIHRHTVTKHLKKNGVPRRVPIRKLNDEQCIQMAEQYNSGKSLLEVGKQFGVHVKTVANELRKLDVAIRPQGKNYR